MKDLFLVAIVALAGPVEAEAPQLAAALGTTAYETALLLRATSPTIVLRTDDRERAVALLGELRARGHDAVACDASAVVASDDMTSIRAFRFDPDALVALGVPQAGGPAIDVRVPYDGIAALVRAMHATRVDTTKESRTNKLSLGRAAMTGGLLMTKTVTSSKTTTVEDKEPVLYVFSRDGAAALVRASRARYEALGAEIKPSQLENFMTVVRKLRERAPRAVYDERLMTTHVAADKIRFDARQQVSQSSASAVDVLAHLVALAATRGASAYR